jgi:pilus assembly protein CpaB
MKKIYIIAAISAILCGILLYFFLSGYEKKGSTADNTTEKEVVIIAKTDIAAYSEITSDMVSEKLVPTGTYPESAAHTVDEVIGKITDCKFATNEPILTTELGSSDDSGSDLSYQIPEGMRAMTISTNATSGVGGYLEVGDLVDVIYILDTSTKEEIKDTGKKQEIAGVCSSVIVEGAQVLKLGSSKYTGEDVYESVTLLLSPKQCSKLAAAEHLGTLKLMLRKKADSKESNVSPYSSSDLID